MKALVIGGSGSIGTAIVDRLLDEGYEVIIHYNTADLTSLKEKYKNNNVEFIQCDLAQDITLSEYFGHLNDIDCLIYTSGTALYGMLQDMSDEDIDYSYALHVRQFIRLSRYFVDTLRKSNHGRIIVISSIWGETGASMESIYSAMKSAQIGFVKALSQELALTSVTVNAIAPGFVSGNMSNAWSKEEMESIVAELPQNRMIEPYEVAHVCAYLCHPMSRSITGTVQKVNGGWYL
ncbi:3-oxoacyl-ACP reductase [Staphylococcus sp. HMSC036D05]|uniref:elongation factor P 5-aminopentanone reductase n=1 Tax=Staphylococcus sp. HMSC036D05 TaxID=1715059 RepID=UPI0008AA0D72|nr:SDR family oxidoreductase [Staphylococcus sp. HMSC036D05]OHO69999.1 3-oxoacyl-ACP reductase [Staphylococcus sp. HMSC036D05]